MKITTVLFQISLFYLALLMFDVSASDLSTSACADLSEGEEIRLDSHGKSMEFIPIPNQGSSDYCWAAAGTQMYDAYRLNKQDSSEPIKISSFINTAISLASTKSKNDQNLKSIFNVAEVVKYLFDNGSCRLRGFLDKKDKDNNLVSFSDILRPMNEIYFLNESYSTKYRKLRLFIRNNFDQRKYDLLFLNSTNQQKIINSLMYHQSAMEFLGTIQEILCSDRQKITTHFQNEELKRTSMNSIFQYYGQSVSHPKNLFQKWIKQKMRKEISKTNGLPQVITVCSKSLYEEGVSPFYDENGNPTMQLNSPNCLNHYLVVMGMKKENKRCQLLVRNSAASSCSDYIKNEKISCIKSMTPRQIWIEENYLLEYANEYYSF